MTPFYFSLLQVLICPRQINLSQARLAVYFKDMERVNFKLFPRPFNKLVVCVEHNKQWKIPKEIGIPDHLTCLLRNLYAGQELIVKTGHRTDWFQIGKGVCQGCI